MESKEDTNDEGNKDVSFMTKNLQDWLNAGDFTRALKFC